MSAARRARIARRRGGGFTLVELLVALVAGLLVALAVVGLSKDATNTFHEETRVASAEMQLRTAMDRLRADLQRTAYMSTANVLTDPKLGPPPSGVTSVQSGFMANFSNSAHMSLATLAGVRLDTTANGALSLSLPNGLSPQAIELAGNFTSVESFAVGGGATGFAAIEDAPVASNPCQGQRVHIDVNSSPAIWRLMGLSGATTTSGDGGVSDGGGSATYDTAFLNAFAPANGGTGSVADASANTWPAFIVRFVDGTGKAQYAATCKDENGGAAKWNNGAPYIDLDSRTPITASTSTAAGGGGFAGVGGGVGQINPIQIVRWEILPSTMTDPLGGDTDKYDLTRTYLDAFGNATGATEVVAEYAVDLKFAFTVDTTTDTTGNYSGSQQTEVVYGMESPAQNQAIADFVTVVATAKPQRIRSVRARIVTRAAQPDRTAPLSAGTGYVYRYCASQVDGGANCTQGTTSWARTRTLMTEVALPNQARLWY